MWRFNYIAFGWSLMWLLTELIMNDNRWHIVVSVIFMFGNLFLALIQDPYFERKTEN